MPHLSEFWEDTIVMLKENYPQEDNSILLLGVHLIQDLNELKAQYPGYKLIIYQTEPLTETHWWSKSFILHKCNNADEIWETNYDNFLELQALGYNVKYRPFTYSKELRRIKNKENPRIDVLFYGTMVPYRVEKLKRMQTSKFNLVTLWGITGEHLDEYIADSKIVLNLGTGDPINNQKESRISYLLNNDKCVVSTPARRNLYGDLIIEDENPIESILEYLKYDEWKQFSEGLANTYGKLAERLKAAPC